LGRSLSALGKKSRLLDTRSARKLDVLYDVFGNSVVHRTVAVVPQNAKLSSVGSLRHVAVSNRHLIIGVEFGFTPTTTPTTMEKIADLYLDKVRTIISHHSTIFIGRTA
jgi:hypothetical protein